VGLEDLGDELAAVLKCLLNCETRQWHAMLVVVREAKRERVWWRSYERRRGRESGATFKEGIGGDNVTRSALSTPQSAGVGRHPNDQYCEQRACLADTPRL